MLECPPEPTRSTHHMRLSRTFGAALSAAAALGVLAAPASADAASFTVWAGPSMKAPKGTPAMANLPQFFPARLQVHVGDAVTFRSKAFATASFLGSAKLAKFAPVVPKPGATYSGLTDSTGASFSFNGMAAFQYNPLVF